MCILIFIRILKFAPILKSAPLLKFVFLLILKFIFSRMRWKHCIAPHGLILFGHMLFPPPPVEFPVTHRLSFFSSSCSFPSSSLSFSFSLGEGIHEGGPVEVDESDNHLCGPSRRAFVGLHGIAVRPLRARLQQDVFRDNGCKDINPHVITFSYSLLLLLILASSNSFSDLLSCFIAFV